MRAISLDYETYYDDDCTVKTLGPYKYCRHPKFEAYLLSVCDGAETWVGHPRDFNWDAINSEDVLVSHNAAFDREVHASDLERGLAPAVSNQWHCTANLAAYICNRRSLADSVSYLFKHTLSKEMRNYMKGKIWADAVREGKDKQLIEYARSDAYWCWKLWNDHSDKWPEHERQLSQLTIDSGKRGVTIDTDLLQKYLIATKREIWKIGISLPWVKDGSKPTSPKAIAEECRKAGIPCPPTKTDDEEGFFAWEKQFSPMHPWIAAVANWRSVSKVLATLELMSARLRGDGTIEAPLLYAGAHTLRWSGTGGINFQNLRKDILLADGVEVDMRRLIVPPPGKKMIIADLAQIEPRVLNWLVGNHELLDNIRKGFSYYEAYARLYKGWSGAPGTLKKALGGEGYTKLKNECLGLGYGMGPARYTEYAGVTLEEAEKVVEGFRAANSKVVDLWKTLDTSFKASVNGTFEVELPSGRCMRYPDVRRQIRMRVDENNKPKGEWAFYADVGGVRRALYGGLLTENLVQATSRDVFAHHLLSLQRPGLQLLFSVHDEAVLVADEDVEVEDVVKIMSQTPDWLEGCPIAAEGMEVRHYQK